MKKTKKLVIFGDRGYAEIVYEYFTHDSDYEVTAFTVEKDYLTKKTFCDLPVVPFEEVAEKYPPSEYEMHVAIAYGQMNRIREKICLKAKEKSYVLANYISSRAFIWHNVKMGENCFIFEDNTLQPFVEIKNNVVLWSGNHIGHGSIIESNCFISSHVVIAGYCKIGKNCFMGINSTIGNHVEVGRYSWISPGVLITKDVPEASLIKATNSDVVPLNEKVLFRKLSSYTTPF